MFKIGDFSRLSRVSVKTLHHYDDVGLLKPAQIDAQTGYRYYTSEQLARLNRLLALKDLGFSLEQIARLLEEGVSPSEMRGMLKLRQEEIQQRMEEEQSRLQRVEARLRQIEQEGLPARYAFRLLKTEPLRIASLRAILPDHHHVGSLFAELYPAVYQLGLRPNGPGIILWHDTEHREQDVDAEVAVPIEGCSPALFPQNGRLQMRELPAENVVSLVHQGPHETVTEAYDALLNWIEYNDYRIVGPSRIVILVWGPDMPADQFVNEVQFPIEH